MTLHEREVQNIKDNLMSLAQNKPNPTSYMLGVAISVLAKLALEDSHNSQIIYKSMKRILTSRK